jgi:DNA-binding response OmpR family regulator
MNILCVEDDSRICGILTAALVEENHHVVIVGNGTDAQQYMLSGRFDLTILDLMIPEPDGFEVLRRVRAERVKTPVLVLSARGTMSDVVRALDLGADDYMTKPFHLEVLFARVRSLARRGPVSETPTLQVGNLTLNRSRREASRDEQILQLTKREFLLLECLMRNAGRSVTRERLIEAAWGLEGDVSHNSLDFHMHGLRGKLSLDTQAGPIRTVRGVGYRLED